MNYEQINLEALNNALTLLIGENGKAMIQMIYRELDAAAVKGYEIGYGRRYDEGFADGFDAALEIEEDELELGAAGVLVGEQAQPSDRAFDNDFYDVWTSRFGRDAD